jgi:hypothetical protein
MAGTVTHRCRSEATADSKRHWLYRCMPDPRSAPPHAAGQAQFERPGPARDHALAENAMGPGENFKRLPFPSQTTRTPL